MCHSCCWLILLLIAGQGSPSSCGCARPFAFSGQNKRQGGCGCASSGRNTEASCGCASSASSADSDCGCYTTQGQYMPRNDCGCR